MTTSRKVAYIFQEPTGKWHVCDDSASILDARGPGYDTKNAAIAALRNLVEQGASDYTHYRTGITAPRKI